MKYRAKRIRAGKYVYRGYVINCIRYYEPEGQDVWECVDQDGEGFGHSFRLRDAKRQVDLEIERISNELAVIGKCQSTSK